MRDLDALLKLPIENKAYYLNKRVMPKDDGREVGFQDGGCF